MGGSVAAGSHLTKTSARVAVNTSPEPVSNWILSLGEDVFVVALGYLALAYPVAALTVVGVLVVMILVFGGAIMRAAWRRLFRRSVAADPPSVA